MLFCVAIGIVCRGDRVVEGGFVVVVVGGGWVLRRFVVGIRRRPFGRVQDGESLVEMPSEMEGLACSVVVLQKIGLVTRKEYDLWCPENVASIEEVRQTPDRPLPAHPLFP